VDIGGAGTILNHPNMTRPRLPAAESMESLDAKPFADAFSAGMLLPKTLDPDFEDALRHVLDNPGSLVRPRLAFQMATACGLNAAMAFEIAHATEALGRGHFDRHSARPYGANADSY
jgi:hypothetical protein